MPYADAHLLSRHAHAPWLKVLDALRDEMPFAVDAARRQVFNWDLSVRFMERGVGDGGDGGDGGGSGSGSGADDYGALKLVRRMDWPDW